MLWSEISDVAQVAAARQRPFGCVELFPGWRWSGGMVKHIDLVDEGVRQSRCVAGTNRLYGCMWLLADHWGEAFEGDIAAQ